MATKLNLILSITLTNIPPGKKFCPCITHLHYLHAAHSNSPHQLIEQMHPSCFLKVCKAGALMDSGKWHNGKTKAFHWGHCFVLGRTLRSLQLILTVGILISTQPIYLQLSFFPLLKFSSSSVGNWGAGGGRQWEELAAQTKNSKKQVKSGLALKYKKLFSKPINYDIAINM